MDKKKLLLYTYCIYIIILNTHKTGLVLTGPELVLEQVCEPQDQGPDFPRTGKTMTMVIARPVQFSGLLQSQEPDLKALKIKVQD